MLKKIIIAVIALVVLVGGTAFYLDNTTVTPISHFWKDYKTWYKTTGNEPITGDETRFLSGKHRGEEGYRVIYINAIGATINKGKAPYKYPEGTVVVKEQYKSKSSYEAGKKPALSIMVKMENGTSPETGDWGYVTGFRRKIHIGTSKNAKFCGGCHSAALLKRNDYVFMNATTYPFHPQNSPSFRRFVAKTLL